MNYLNEVDATEMYKRDTFAEDIHYISQIKHR